MDESNSYFKILFNLPVLNATNFNAPVINLGEPVSRALDRLVRYNTGAVIVVEDESPVGIVTERDILDRVLRSERDPDQTKIDEVMSYPIISIDSTKPIRDAIQLMRDNDIRRLAVIENDSLIGLTTERRLLNAAHYTYLEQSRRIAAGTVGITFDRPVVAYMSSYPPRECGIATFTEDLVDAINRQMALSPPVIIALNDRGGYYDYPMEVKLQVDRDELDSFQSAAEVVNDAGIDAVNIQHEYGLFGGDWGENLISFMEDVKKPIVTTLHTILRDPPKKAEDVLREVVRLSHRVIVLARVGAKILEERYDVFPDKVRYIPHGCPNVPFVRSKTAKEGLGLEDRLVLSTFGLISRGKGIEYAIQSLPEIVKDHPQVLYLVIGETHPEVRKHEGESYRQSLLSLVDELGVQKNVRFVNKFLSKSELIRFLQATDVYILPYPNPDQISSGTLLYALCTGKAIVSTPFLHAEEVVGQGAATRCEFKDPESLSENVNALLDYDSLRYKYEERAYEYSREMIWPNVAMRYVNEFYKNLGM